MISNRTHTYSVVSLQNNLRYLLILGTFKYLNGYEIEIYILSHHRQDYPNNSGQFY